MRFRLDRTTATLPPTTIAIAIAAKIAYASSALNPRPHAPASSASGRIAGMPLRASAPSGKDEFEKSDVNTKSCRILEDGRHTECPL